MSKNRSRKTNRGNSPDRKGSSKSSTTGYAPDDFNPDYSYVKKDLRTIGILAGIFITILVVLSFFI